VPADQLPPRLAWALALVHFGMLLAALVFTLEGWRAGVHSA